MSKTLDKLDEVGPEVIDSVRELTGKGIAFIETQAPELCNEVILRGVYLHGLYMAISLTVMVISLIAFWKLHKWWLKAAAHANDECDPSILPLLLIAIVVFAGIGVGFGQACSNACSMLSIWVAPRLYVLEYLSDLVN